MKDMTNQEIFNELIEKYYGRTPKNVKPDWARGIDCPVTRLIFECMDKVREDCNKKNYNK